MELVNNSFDPTPKLKSSPVPITFVSFNRDDNNCSYCGEKYTKTPFYYPGYGYQKYCKKCLSSYLNNITDNNISIYLDAYYGISCSKHEISMTKELQNIQECCKICLEILCFKQLPEYSIYFDDTSSPYYNVYENVIESEKNCKLCGKSLYQGTDNKIYHFKLCSDCYLISIGQIESTLTKKPISIIYLPWWHYISECNACKSDLKFTSDCQKYCKYCYIYYTGCRYCLTTNIIVGLADHSQCKKCKRISIIINSSENSKLDNLLPDLRLNIIYDNLKIDKFANTVKKIGKYFKPYSILNRIYGNVNIAPIEWIPYSQFTNVKEITKGGFGIIYQATWSKDDNIIVVALKRFENSKNISKYFLNELKLCQHRIDGDRVIKVYGITKDPESEDYILVMKYASEGDLHNYLQKKFTEITWNKQKLMILWQISEGLENIHGTEFTHRDFHSGNILFDLSKNSDYSSKVGEQRRQWKIGDLGLSQPVNKKNNKSSTSLDDEIYGVIPYIAPEIFKGSAFSKKADIYSFGMIMWEFTTGCKPFSDVGHGTDLILKILDGERPKVTEDTPECYADLMKSCWDPNPEKRPDMKKIRKTLGRWSFFSENNQAFDEAEMKRIELIKSSKLGPEFAGKYHSGAIYTSRPLSSLISKCSTYSTISLYNDQDYISTDLGFDIDIESLSSQNLSSTIQNSLTSLKKRNIEELDTETRENRRKHVKTSFNYP